jgi:hypothetical protein
MPAKKPGLFDVTGKEPPKPKKPTLRQYLKESKNDVYPQYFRIETIWFPGNWENYSIETTDFRASIAATHPLFDALECNAVKAFSESEGAILLVLLDNEGTIGLGESTIHGKYTRIGNAGFRFNETPGAN